MNCLLCYKPIINSSELDYHTACIKKVFGYKQMPLIEIDDKMLSDYAKKMVESNAGITGVQPKLSLWLEESKKDIRFTVIDNKSNYIIKPQSETYQSLPENEDLCMHLATIFGIKTATHGLIKLPSGNLAYITKRFDRVGDTKIAVEDLCQLSETLTENKYRGSYEKVGKVIKSYSTQVGFDMLNYFSLLVFSFVTGNADMHLKNFSMLETGDGAIFSLSPAYDLVSTFLVIENEDEQMSLTLNGRKNKLKKQDFDVLASNLALTEKQRDNCYSVFKNKMNDAIEMIENSFLPIYQKEKLKTLLVSRIEMFQL